MAPAAASSASRAVASGGAAAERPAPGHLDPGRGQLGHPERIGLPQVHGGTERSGQLDGLRKPAADPDRDAPAVGRRRPPTTNRARRSSADSKGSAEGLVLRPAQVVAGAEAGDEPSRC